jgi:hypothetical protein
LSPLSEHNPADADRDEVLSESSIHILGLGDIPFDDVSMDADLGDGMLLDVCPSLEPAFGYMYGAESSPDADVHALRVPMERHPSVDWSVSRRSLEFGDWPCTAGSAPVQVGTPADVLRHVASLGRVIAELKKDLDAAREQRDKAVRDGQAAAAREASVLRQLSAFRNTVEHAPTSDACSR